MSSVGLRVHWAKVWISSCARSFNKLYVLPPAVAIVSDTGGPIGGSDWSADVGGGSATVWKVQQGVGCGGSGGLRAMLR